MRLFSLSGHPARNMSYIFDNLLLVISKYIGLRFLSFKGLNELSVH